jgi:dTDP-4-amino-4,6-dideoxygalactose transaminase
MTRSDRSEHNDPLYVTRPRLPDLDRYHELLSEIWASGRVSNFGPFHDELERRIAARVGTGNLTLWNNGTTALLGALRALDLDGEVITTPFTFPATTHVLNWMGLEPVFADIDPVNLTIDPECVRARITSRTSAVLGVHVYGHWCDTTGIADIARQHDIRVIYDGAHAFAVPPPEDSTDAFGDITMFSFHATKIFHTAEGAALVTRDEHVTAKLQLIRNFGIAGEDEIPAVGINGKLNELQAALGLLLLEEIDDAISQRRVVAGWYEQGLSGLAGITIASGLGTDAAQQYLIVRVNETEAGISRDHLQTELRKLNIMARRYFHPLCSRLTAYRDSASAQPALLPNAERAARECLAMPFHERLDRAAIDRVSDGIRQIQALGRAPA